MTNDQLEKMAEQLTWLVARQERHDELWNELMPVGRRVMTSVAERLDEAEKSGLFDLGRELVGVAGRVLEHYRAEDVRQLAGAIVPILDAVRALTQPGLMSAVSHAAVALEKSPGKPVGLLGVLRATRDADVRQGLAVTVELLRRIGRGTRPPPAGGERGEHLASVLGPRRRLPAVNASRGPDAAAAACGVPRPGVPAQVIDGVAFTADGYLTDAAQWTKPLAEKLAAGAGITLAEAHWKVLEAARAEYAQARASPNIRRLTQIQPFGTKELYALFPKAPGRTIAKLAGIPKPTGCL